MPYHPSIHLSYPSIHTSTHSSHPSHPSIHPSIPLPIPSHPIPSIPYSSTQTRTLPNLVLATYFQLPTFLPTSLPPSPGEKPFPSYFFLPFSLSSPENPTVISKCRHLPTYQRVTRIIHIQKVAAVRTLYCRRTYTYTYIHIHMCNVKKKERKTNQPQRPCPVLYSPGRESRQRDKDPS